MKNRKHDEDVELNKNASRKDQEQGKRQQQEMDESGRTGGRKQD